MFTEPYRKYTLLFTEPYRKYKILFTSTYRKYNLSFTESYRKYTLMFTEPYRKYTLLFTEPYRKYTLLFTEPYRKYTIWCRAFNLKNEGNSSTPVQVMSDVAGPGILLKNEMKCSGDSEILQEIVCDTTRISSCFFDFHVVSRTISESPIHLIG